MVRNGLRPSTVAQVQPGVYFVFVTQWVLGGSNSHILKASLPSIKLGLCFLGTSFLAFALKAIERWSAAVKFACGADTVAERSVIYEALVQSRSWMPKGSGCACRRPSKTLVAVDPSAKSLTVWGFSGKPRDFPKSESLKIQPNSSQ